MSIIIGVILAAAFFMMVMHWWAEGIFDTSEAIILATILCGLIFGLFAVKKVWQFILVLIPLASAGGYALYSYNIGNTRSYYKRKRQEYMDAILADPRNIGAREFLAETCYKMGDLDSAIAEMQAAVDIGAGQECNYKLARWTKERHLRETLNPVCCWCETENALGERKCNRCGADLPYENALARWLVGGKTSRARYYFLIVIGIAVVAVSLLLFPPIFALISILLFLATLAGWSLINSARK